MEEALPGLFHWSAMHPRIGSRVSSWWLEGEGEGVLIDPLLPEDLDLVAWLRGRPQAPVAIVLSNRHHLRDSERLIGELGCELYCHADGRHELPPQLEVRSFRPAAGGSGLPGGIVVHQVGALCPDESALHLPAQRALLFADAIVRGGEYGAGGPLGFVPDGLMDDPPATKRGLLAAFTRLLEEIDFDHLLLAHGGPVLGDGRTQLEELVQVGGRTAFEL